MKPDEIAATAQIDLIRYMIEIVMENGRIEGDEALIERMRTALNDIVEVQDTIYET